MASRIYDIDSFFSSSHGTNSQCQLSRAVRSSRDALKSKKWALLVKSADNDSPAAWYSASQRVHPCGQAQQLLVCAKTAGNEDGLVPCR